MSKNKTIPQISQIAMNPVAPGVAKCLYLLGFACNMLRLPILNISIGG